MKCPKCAGTEYKRHCPDTNKTCKWIKCTMCDTVIDKDKGIAYRWSGTSAKTEIFKLY